ncbi:MAG: peptidylprolyl isomerase [Acidimicrobiia bacterium]
MHKIVPLALACLFAVSCGGSGAVMARVGDATITEGDVAALFEARSMPIGDDLRSALFRLSALEVLLDAMEADFDLELDPAEVDRTFEEMQADLTARGVTPSDALGVPNAGMGMVRFNAELAVIRALVSAQVLRSAEFLDTLYRDGIGVTTVCVQHVLVATEDEALDVLERLDDGEDIGDVAADVSLDTSERGDLGCRPASEYVTDFAYASVQADIAVPTGPVQTQFGFHILIVSDREVLDRALVESDPLAYLSGVDAGFAWNNWVNDTLRAAEVHVEPQYGTWSPTGIQAPDAE